ncbi:putative AAA family ATPase [Megavirus courdo7]|uniref:Putative AAA family ATPase n=1 Tax=Megavirus courdo7 TaxID=1128135 RepID=H2EAW0_9VIRU|nr:putative AAA family ATPase [Megavirus courdo7]
MSKRTFDNAFTGPKIAKTVIDERNNKKRKNNYNNNTTKISIRNDDDPCIHINKNIGDFVKIGNFVYKTKLYYDESKYIQRIGITKSQFEDIRSHIFEKDYVTVSNYNDELPNIKILRINISTDTVFDIFIDRKKLTEYILSKLRNKPVTFGQCFDINYNNIPLLITVYDINDLFIGLVTKSTKLDFKNIDSNIIIQNTCMFLKNCDIKITITKCINSNTSSNQESSHNFPIIIDENILVKYIQETLTDRFIDGAIKVFNRDDNEFTFTINVPNNNYQYTRFRNTYKLLKDDTKFILKSNTNNVIISNGTQIAEKICFNCTSLNVNTNFIVSVNDMTSYIYNKFNKLTQKQSLELKIDEKILSLSVEYITPKAANNVAYSINRKTKILFNTEIKSNCFIVSNKIPFKLETIDLKIIENKRKSIFSFSDDDEKMKMFDANKLKKIVKNKFPTIVTPKFRSKVSYNGINYLIVVKNITFSGSNNPKKYQYSGEIVDDTKINFVFPKNTKHVLVNNNINNDVPTNPIEELEKYVGGISQELGKVVRTICLSRGKLKLEYQSRGLKPVKGIIFYGPPGTGKTTIARNLGDILGCHGDQFRLMSGPEIFNKWVGQSESNVRDIFKPAKDAWKKYGDKSPTYMVVIDEIDAMLPVREGSSSSPVRDSVVNQFLAEMDGLEQFNNFICIGITNRLELLDPAVIRSGRFGVHIKIDLPNKSGRVKIFEIHTKKLSEKLDNIDFEKLADLTEGMNGADIEGIIELSSLYSLERLNKMDELNDEIIKTHGLINHNDFIQAISEFTLNNKKSTNSDNISHIYM